MKDLIRVIKNGKWVAIENTLEGLQKEVDGYIETITIFDGIVLICDEEGLLKGKAPSCNVLGCEIVGDWLLVGADSEGEFTDLRFEDWKSIRGLGIIKPAKAV